MNEKRRILNKRGYCLKFVEQNNVNNRKTKEWAMWKEMHNQSECLGYVRWHGAWRQYVFSPEVQTIWSAGCLSFVTKFLADVTAEHLKTLKVGNHGQ
jgi:hypothetical protein